jgi:fibronectin-binding autotransporter adhesin
MKATWTFNHTGSRRLALAIILGLSGVITCPRDGRAAWVGSGAGGGGTDLTISANWAAGVIDGSFVNQTANAGLVMSDNLAITQTNPLNAAWTSGAVTSLSIVSDNVALPRTLTLNGANSNATILVPRSTTPTTITIGTAGTNDILLNLGSFTSGSGRRLVQSSGSGGTVNSTNVVINAKVSATVSTGNVFSFVNDGFASLTLANDANDFHMNIHTTGLLSYTSISSNGGGGSALGKAISTNSIQLIHGGNLNYIGTSNAVSDRTVGTSSTTTGRILYLSNNSSNGSSLQLTNSASVIQLFSAVGANSNLRLVGNSATANNLYAGQLVGTGGNSTTYSVHVNSGLWELTNTGSTVEGGVQIASSLGGSALQQPGVNSARATLVVHKLANQGLASSIGTGAVNPVIEIARGGTLKYVGAGDSTDRPISFNSFFNYSTVDIGLDSSGTGALAFTNTGAVAFAGDNQPRTFVLKGSNADANSFAMAIANGPSNPTSLRKEGAGSWTLNAVNTYTGSTLVRSGELRVTGSVANSLVTVGDSGSASTPALLGGGNGLVSPTTAFAGITAITQGAVVDPGNADHVAGVLNTTTLALSNGAQLAMQIGGVSVGGNSLTGYDRLNVLSPTTSANVADGVLALTDITAGSIASDALLFLVVNNGSGAASAAFNSVLLNGSSVGDVNNIVIGGQSFALVYNASYDGSGTYGGLADGLGNDIALVAVVIPEPSCLVMVGVAVVLGMRRCDRITKKTINQ